MNSPDDKQLRDEYRSLGGESPSPDIDARILAEARRAIRPRRHPAAWTGLVALAASIGFALVMLPQFLVETPDEAPARMADMPASEPAPPQRLRVTAAPQAAEEAADRAIAENTERRTEKQAAEQLLDTRAMQSLDTARAAAIAEAVEESGPDLAALRAELDGAPEPQWRATLVALRDSGRRPLAEELMPAYRETFDLDPSLTLDMLVAEVKQ